ncbi:hypothetical protein pb186bvf_006493 [Paramecium bursaria]
MNFIMEEDSEQIDYSSLLSNLKNMQPSKPIHPFLKFKEARLLRLSKYEQKVGRQLIIKQILYEWHKVDSKVKSQIKEEYEYDKKIYKILLTIWNQMQQIDPKLLNDLKKENLLMQEKFKSKFVKMVLKQYQN